MARNCRPTTAPKCWPFLMCHVSIELITQPSLSCCSPPPPCTPHSILLHPLPLSCLLRSVLMDSFMACRASFGYLTLIQNSLTRRQSPQCTASVAYPFAVCLLSHAAFLLLVFFCLPFSVSIPLTDVASLAHRFTSRRPFYLILNINKMASMCSLLCE